MTGLCQARAFQGRGALDSSAAQYFLEKKFKILAHETNVGLKKIQHRRSGTEIVNALDAAITEKESDATLFGLRVRFPQAAMLAPSGD
ncbi:MAG TPA: hypothetical protein VJ692_04025 [Nitrospiraceae bacterium]|nr:hypothetical protein [Nitrospiraceae bacterium]